MNQNILQNPTDQEIKQILQTVHTIALVGASPKVARPSNMVGQFLTDAGYQVFGVNPGIAGKFLFGQKVYASLNDIPKDIRIDMVDIFRRSDRVAPVVEAALRDLPSLPHVIWMQIDVAEPRSAAQARADGVTVVQNRCPKIEFARLNVQPIGRK